MPSYFTGFSKKRTLIGPVDRPASPNQAGPAHPRPTQRKKRTKTHNGHCCCTSRGSCAVGYCVCYSVRKICNANCKCVDYLAIFARTRSQKDSQKDWSTRNWDFTNWLVNWAMSVSAKLQDLVYDIRQGKNFRVTDKEVLENHLQAEGLSYGNHITGRD